jgi:branched-chain amino acid transport system substrate-binding protein
MIWNTIIFSSTTTLRAAGLSLFAAWLVGFAALSAGPARAEDPIKIGFGMALTGALAGAGKSALLSMEIWREDVNAQGGLLGRPVEFVYYDDQTNPALVPGIYTKLINIDGVDLIVSGYGSVTIAPAMPIAMNYNRLFLSLFALAGNEEFRYDRYFQILPAGPQPRLAWSRGFFELAMSQDPQPKTVALVGADAEFARNMLLGARANAETANLEVVYDRTYPMSTVDFTPIIRSIRATEPDIVYVASYPPDSAGIVRAISEVGIETQMLGGGMVGIQYASLMGSLGPLLNGIVNYDFWVPEPTLQFAGIEQFLIKYQARAADAGVDPLGYYLPPYAYAYLQILGQAVEATGTLDDAVLADYIHINSFQTVVGPVRFGEDGEWAETRILMVQYQGIEEKGLEPFTRQGTRVVLYPENWVSGSLNYPYGGGN